MLGVFVSEDGSETVEASRIRREMVSQWDQKKKACDNKHILFAFGGAVGDLEGIALAVFDTQEEADRQHDDIREWYRGRKLAELVFAHEDRADWRREYVRELIYDLRERKVKPNVATQEMAPLQTSTAGLDGTGV